MSDKLTAEEWSLKLIEAAFSKDPDKEMPSMINAIARQAREACAKAVCPNYCGGIFNDYERQAKFNTQEKVYVHYRKDGSGGLGYCQADAIHALSDEKLMGSTK